MKLVPPLPLSEIGQGFGQNADPAYAAQGLKGHPGIDFGIGAPSWGLPIPCAIAGSVVSAVLSRDNPNLEAYRAVNTIFDDTDGNSYEIQYGHCSAIYTTTVPGKVLALGETMANIGNTGDVYAGNPATLITDAEKQAGNHNGAHVHFQVRLIKKEIVNVPINPKQHYLNDGAGLLVLNNARYFVPNWDNGYNGCIDPAEFFAAAPAPTGFHYTFNVYLVAGTPASPEVRNLQTALQTLKGKDGVPYMQAGMYGPYGPGTTAALLKFQTDQGIKDDGTHFGPQTRAAMNAALINQ